MAFLWAQRQSVMVTWGEEARSQIPEVDMPKPYLLASGLWLTQWHMKQLGPREVKWLAKGPPAIKSQGGLKSWLESLCVLRRVLYVAVVLRFRIPAYCGWVTEVRGWVLCALAELL